MAFRSMVKSKGASWLRLLMKAGLVIGLSLTVAGVASASGSAESGGSKLIKVGIVNLPPEESGYRQANVEDFNTVFSKANGYDARQTNTADNSEQIAAAQGYIRDGVDVLLISAANASGWDNVLQSAKSAGVVVYLFDRLSWVLPLNRAAAPPFSRPATPASSRWLPTVPVETAGASKKPARSLRPPSLRVRSST